MVRLFDDVHIEDIADAIRAKNGSTDTYKTSEMAAAIAAIEVGGNSDALLDRSVTEISSNVSEIGGDALSGCDQLVTADFPLATTIGSNAFHNCKKLTTLSIPLVTTVGMSAFLDCDSLVNITLPSVVEVYSNGFNSCDNLKSVDFPSATSLGSTAFRYCSYLDTVILRSPIMCTLGANIFSGCYHMIGTQNEDHNPDGLHDGYIYVPSALLGEYTTTYSATVYQFRALESYTVDGTTIGALDESKI